MRDSSNTATRPLRAIYSSGPEADAIEGARPEPPREHDPAATVEAPPAFLRERDELGVVIDDFMQAAEDGEAEDAYGSQYPPEGLRELHSALSHVKSELGTMQMPAIQRWHVQGMLDQLRGAGLAPGRLTAVVEALHSLYVYAIQRGLVEDSPVIWLTFPQAQTTGAPVASRAPRVAAAPAAMPAPAPAAMPAPPPAPMSMETPMGTPAVPTPTHAMLALGGRILLWTVRITVTLFVLAAIVLVVEFA